MGRARRHHTVPAFYLRRFAGANGQIERVAKPSGERAIMSVRNATVEVDFYTVETDEGTGAGSVDSRAVNFHAASAAS